MNIVSWSEFRKSTTEELDAIVPAIITKNGEPYYVIGLIGTTINLSDMHPRVRHQLKALENRARAGMPKPVQFIASKES